eukprot:CAMPEP_0117480692 /NCGR_PEP_ID=MMETSP0784-20121206/12519_1 /TAXON_ID=39447 /ORGANISM="" /LENGTH=119 /DNA_ID=CAMNT_0005275133 /DNA_START=263 /DNA_END=622 /DNA_ORIENTATION=+
MVQPQLRAQGPHCMNRLRVARKAGLSEHRASAFAPQALIKLVECPCPQFRLGVLGLLCLQELRLKLQLQDGDKLLHRRHVGRHKRHIEPQEAHSGVSVEAAELPGTISKRTRRGSGSAA